MSADALAIMREALWQYINDYAATEPESLARLNATIAVERTLDKLRVLACPRCASGGLIEGAGGGER